MFAKEKDIWQQRLSSDWSLVGVGYAALGRGFNKWAYDIRGLQFDRIFKRLNIIKGTALDVGSGTGFYVQRLLKNGMDVTGVDISETAVRNLKIKFPHVTFIQGTIENITGRYDVIVMMDVLFHILDDDDYRETLTRISSCMSSGSTFIFTENFSDERIGKRHHISRGRRFIEEAVTNAGLEIILRRPFFCIMNQPIRKNAGETLWWKAVVSFLIRFPAAGWVLGAILYPLEAALLYFSVGASTDIVVCKRKTSIAL